VKLFGYFHYEYSTKNDRNRLIMIEIGRIIDCCLMLLAVPVVLPVLFVVLLPVVDTVVDGVVLLLPAIAVLTVVVEFVTPDTELVSVLLEYMVVGDSDVVSLEMPIILTNTQTTKKASLLK
jgi:ABC-type anion transport system duplicated permease subunit